MHVTDQLQQVQFFLAEDRLITILKQVSMSAMPAIESDGIASQKAAHDRGNGNRPGLQQQVKMIRDQRPGQAFGGCFGAKGRQVADEIVSIDIVLKDRTALDATTNNVVEGTRGIYAGLSKHRQSRPYHSKNGNAQFHGRYIPVPLFPP